MRSAQVHDRCQCSQLPCIDTCRQVSPGPSPQLLSPVPSSFLLRNSRINSRFVLLKDSLNDILTKKLDLPSSSSSKHQSDVSI